MDAYPVLLALFGVAILLAAVLPARLARLPMSWPILYVAAGALVFWLPLDLEGPRPTDHSDTTWAERVTELVVIVSLTGAGLKMRRRVGLRTWASTWRLLAVAMPLTIAGISLLGGLALGLPLATAILLGAVLAPTDPVLAADVQLNGPGDEEDDDEVRFALTSEAGLNDGLAFPFTNLAIAIAAGGSWFGRWVLDDVVLKLTVGLIAGLVLGRLLAYVAFGPSRRWALAGTGRGFVALGATLLVYGTTELAHGYGFLAVFVAAVVLRRSELDHDYQGALHEFAEDLERLASAVFLLLLGGAVADGALAALTWTGALVALAIVLVVRPLAGAISFVGAPLAAGQRRAIAFFGIRGMGSVYYLAHAVDEEAFPLASQVWAVAIAVILASIVIHGVLADPILDRVGHEPHPAVRPEPPAAHAES